MTLGLIIDGQPKSVVSWFVVDKWHRANALTLAGSGGFRSIIQ